MKTSIPLSRLSRCTSTLQAFVLKYQLTSDFAFHVNRTNNKKCCSLVVLEKIIVSFCSCFSLQTATQGDGAFFQASLGLKDKWS